MTRYVATINVPGYLPMDDAPPVFDTPAQAWDYLMSEVERGWWDIGDVPSEEQLAVERDIREASQGVGTVYGPTPGYDGDHDLGLAYSVSVCEGECCD